MGDFLLKLGWSHGPLGGYKSPTSDQGVRVIVVVVAPTSENSYVPVRLPLSRRP